MRNLMLNQKYVSERDIEESITELYLKIYKLDNTKFLFFDLKYLNRLYTLKKFEIHRFVNTYRLTVEEKNIFFKNHTERYYFKNQMELNILINNNIDRWVGNLITIKDFITGFTYIRK